MNQRRKKTKLIIHTKQRIPVNGLKKKTKGKSYITNKLNLEGHTKTKNYNLSFLPGSTR